jgi:hypothetical protein
MEFDIDFMQSYDRDSVAAELRRVAALAGKNSVTIGDIKRLSRVSTRTILARFGTMRLAHEAAGLDASGYRKYTNDELFKFVTDLWTMTLKDAGRSPLISDVKKYGLPFSAHMITGRFGTWRQALVAASVAWEGKIPPTFGKRGRLKRKPVPQGTRFAVFKRDLYTCQICGRAGGVLVLDHVIPVCRGGSNAMSNLQVLCVECNQGKGSNLQ